MIHVLSVISVRSLNLCCADVPLFASSILVSFKYIVVGSSVWLSNNLEVSVQLM